jgi:hypothetical protein
MPALEMTNSYFKEMIVMLTQMTLVDLLIYANIKVQYYSLLDAIFVKFYQGKQITDIIKQYDVTI